MGRRIQPRNEKCFTLFRNSGSNFVESAALLMESVAAPHEHWAELGKPMHDTEHADDDTTTRRREGADPGPMGGARGPQG